MANVIISPDKLFEIGALSPLKGSGGRRKIVSDRKSKDLRDKDVLADVLNNAMATHNLNRGEIEYLLNYKNGQQEILNKRKKVRKEINNKVVINHAQMATRNIVGYFLGTPIQYVQDGLRDRKDLVDELNRCVQYEDKSNVDREIGEYQSITGTAFRIIYRDKDVADEVPFEDRSLDPRTTFVVYENSISERPLLGVTFYDKVSDKNVHSGSKFYVYTDFGRYMVDTDGNRRVQAEDIGELEPYDVGGVPIIEYPNNMSRTGDWELMIGLMEAINSLHSGRFDDIDQTVQSLLVFINAEIDDERYASMREEGIVSLVNNTGAKSDIKNINNTLDQSGMHMFAEQLEDLLYALIGIPSRNNRPGGGGDTGTAVELRDGWADLEIIARTKEATFKKAEKRALKIILHIFNLDKDEDLRLMDIDIKFSRNKTNNLLVKTQAYQTLVQTKTLDPVDCLAIVDIVSDVNEFIARGQAFWGDDYANRNSEGKEQLAQEMLETATGGDAAASKGDNAVKGEEEVE